MISISVAMTKDRIIGRDNDLPWHLPEDLKQFKERTLGHPVIMGRKTYESIGRPLPRRRNILVSRTLTEAPEGTELFSTLEAALEAVAREEESFIIGGAEIYRQTLDRSDRLYISRVEGEYHGDTRFPEFSPLQWILKETEEFPGFTLEIWERKRG